MRIYERVAYKRFELLSSVTDFGRHLVHEIIHESFVVCRLFCVFRDYGFIASLFSTGAASPFDTYTTGKY